MPLWHRLAIVGAVLIVTAVVARLIDRRIARRHLPPQAVTRYRVLRRSITTAIVFIGLFSALLVIPQVPAVAGQLRELVAGERDGNVEGTALDGQATVAVRAVADGAVEAEQLESDLRLRAHDRLRAAGVFG